MISVDEALVEIERRLWRPSAERVAVADAAGRVLAESVASDIDSPPYDKSIVDGYALRAAEVSQQPTALVVIEEVVAGAVPRRSLSAGEATRIMTGAPLPEGADAVVMVERTESLAGDGLGQVVVRSEGIVAGQNIARRATSMRRGEVVLHLGHRLRSIEIGVLSEVGRVEVEVARRPHVAVLATGNELVPPTELPASGQIRNSNGAMLVSAVRRAGCLPIDLGIGRDEPQALTRLITDGLQADVLLISGGVSAGVLDLVPGVLAGLGVRQVFHKVRVKPGKPVWFGVREEAGSTLVFGLPGNPVSSLVCFELFVRPALIALAGGPFEPATISRAALAAPFVHRGERPTYHPGYLAAAHEGWRVEPLAWQGSGDLRTLASANSLIHFAAGERTYHVGDLVAVSRLET